MNQVRYNTSDIHIYKSLIAFYAEPGDAPTNFTAVVVSSTAIQLTWNQPQLPYGVILSYTISYNISNGNIKIHNQSSTDPEIVVIDGLQEYTWYKFEIFASTRIGAGPQAYVIARTGISGNCKCYQVNEPLQMLI